MYSLCSTVQYTVLQGFESDKSIDFRHSFPTCPQKGSMVDIVKQAREQGLGVVILNPNAHWWVDGQASVTIPFKKDYSMIPRT